MKVSAFVRTAIRETRRAQRLGDNPCCHFCWESNPLRLVRGRGHHPTSRKRDPELATVVCGSCHLEAHGRLTDAGIPMEMEGTVKARTASRLRAMAQFRRQEADALEKWADELEDMQ